MEKLLVAAPDEPQGIDWALDRDYISRWVDELGLRDEREAAQKTAPG